MAMDHIEIDENLSDTSIVDLKRTAIDSFGRLGWFYDIYHDRVIENSNINSEQNIIPTDKICKSEIKYGNDDKPQNLLRLLSEDDNLRLSILLTLTSNNLDRASLINYPHESDEYSRLFHYSYVDRVEKLPEIDKNTTSLINHSESNILGSHVITGIEWGFEFIIVLQLSNGKHTVNHIDPILDKLLTSLCSDEHISLSNEDQINLSKDILRTTVYTNIPGLKNLSNILEIDQFIKQNMNQIDFYPINYTLRPIKFVYPQYDGEFTKYHILTRELNEAFEYYLLQLRDEMKQLEKLCKDHQTKSLSNHLREQVHFVDEQFSDIKQKFESEIQRVRNLVIEIRRAQRDTSTFEQIMDGKELTVLKEHINLLKKKFNDIQAKENFIQDLKQCKFEYINAVNYAVENTEQETIAKIKLTYKDQNYRIICSTDNLKNDNLQEFDKLIADSSDMINKNPDLRLIYADFSYCSFELNNTVVLLPSNEPYENIMEQSIPESSTAIEKNHLTSLEPMNLIKTPDDVNTCHIPLTAQPKAADETINILLLGETGVGKSTFINAFVNYLTFETLQQAEKDAPVVLMPVSFILTTGDHFEEHIVRFGDVNDSTNEDFQHPGQSVTQHCKSYVFNLTCNDGKKLRIIDTPGFSDTRGVEQDDRNMEHILEYINNLDNLHFICVLLKPNDARLNIFYRSCFLRILSILDQNPMCHIIFCFTNGRSTFYAPGDTAPILKKMICSLPIKNIPFKKENVFCFDSESFRYLVAVQNKIHFCDLDKEEYEMSWIKSMTEAKRLINYICETYNAL